MNKTNVMRLLEAAGIPFEIREYEVDEGAAAGNRLYSLRLLTNRHEEKISNVYR